jgi:hypothetical protein
MALRQSKGQAVAPVGSEAAQLAAASGKMVLLDKLLPKLRAEGKKVCTEPHHTTPHHTTPSRCSVHRMAKHWLRQAATPSSSGLPMQHQPHGIIPCPGTPRRRS